jgi:hypothetical protein
MSCTIVFLMCPSHLVSFAVEAVFVFLISSSIGSLMAIRLYNSPSRKNIAPF